MCDRRWYRSLYWRIGLGFLVCVATVLGAQAAFFLWAAGRPGALSLVRSPENVATVVATTLSTELAQNERYDVYAYLRAALGSGPPVAVVVFADGRHVTNALLPPPEPVLRANLRWLQRQRAQGELPGGQERARIDQAARERPFPRGPRRPLPVVVNGTLVGAVSVLPGPRGLLGAFSSLGLLVLGPSIALFILGSAAMAFFVFRPAQRRLLSLQQAAEAIGAGHTEARANEAGGDEVAALAASFNRMAIDLETRVRELREADRVRRQLLADVSHELATPLTAIRGYLETLAMPEAIPDTTARDRYLRIVTDETQRLQAIIGDLLDIARLEGRGTPLAMEPVDVAGLFRRASERHDPLLREKALTLTTTVAPDAAAVLGDARRLEQVVENLVANAVRHTPPGGSIVLSTAQTNGAISIFVRDTGPGIPHDHLARIFERFTRVQAARDQASGGSGLGLAIVRAIVEAHGGRVTASNVPDGGACFEVVLAAAPASPDAIRHG